MDGLIDDNQSKTRLASQVYVIDDDGMGDAVAVSKLHSKPHRHRHHRTHRSSTATVETDRQAQHSTAQHSTDTRTAQHSTDTRTAHSALWMVVELRWKVGCLATS
eukprot:scaffold1307_cov166-Ochromonas_danica.AAC.38